MSAPTLLCKAFRCCRGALHRAASGAKGSPLLQRCIASRCLRLVLAVRKALLLQRCTALRCLRLVLVARKASRCCTTTAVVRTAPYEMSPQRNSQAIQHFHRQLESF